jgi:urocanate hydratase
MHQNEKKFYRQRKKLALRNALRYFEAEHHPELIQEFHKN